MSDEEKPKSWWHTLPGTITSLAAAVTALAGMVVAIIQILPILWPPVPPPAPDQDHRPVVIGTRPVPLPAMHDYTLDNVTFTLLKAHISPRTPEKETLEMWWRVINHGTGTAIYWSQSFRLIVDGVPMAPGLPGSLLDMGDLVPGGSAKEGYVMFVIPQGTTAAKLKITYGHESTEIALNLVPPH